MAWTTQSSVFIFFIDLNKHVGEHGCLNSRLDLFGMEMAFNAHDEDQLNKKHEEM